MDSSVFIPATTKTRTRSCSNRIVDHDATLSAIDHQRLVIDSSGELCKPAAIIEPRRGAVLVRKVGHILGRISDDQCRIINAECGVDSSSGVDVAERIDRSVCRLESSSDRDRIGSTVGELLLRNRVLDIELECDGSGDSQRVSDNLVPEQTRLTRHHHAHSDVHSSGMRDGDLGHRHRSSDHQHMERLGFIFVRCCDRSSVRQQHGREHRDCRNREPRSTASNDRVLECRGSRGGRSSGASALVLSRRAGDGVFSSEQRNVGRMGVGRREHGSTRDRTSGTAVGACEQRGVALDEADIVCVR